jgi:hypothetical protein
VWDPEFKFQYQQQQKKKNEEKGESLKDDLMRNEN